MTDPTSTATTPVVDAVKALARDADTHVRPDLLLKLMGAAKAADEARRPQGVYVVMYSNYEPAEVRAIYDNQAAADQHAEALGEGWHACYWGVGSQYGGDES